MAGGRQAFRWVPSPVPLTDASTRFGGQPAWTGPPTWPLSASLREPMTFVGQVLLPPADDRPERLLLLFLAGRDGEDVENTWEPEAGENALLCQPGRVPGFVDTIAAPTGPSVGEDVAVTLVPGDPDTLSYVGGAPTWLQQDETPPGFDFAFQLDSTELPFAVNFGDAGVGYAFVDHRAGEGRFLWQSA